MADRRLRLARPVARQGQSWYCIAKGLQAKDSDGGGTYAEVYIYDEISWWGITAQSFVDELREITDPQIHLHLNSPGGDVFDAHAIYQALVDHKAQVTTLIDGLAASAASVIAMAGERIVMGRAAMLMIHDAWGLQIGNAADMRDTADRLDKISDVIASVYAERAGGPLEFWRAAMVEESWYDADEAVQAGLADEVRSRKASSDQGDGDQGERPEDRWDLSVFTYAGRRAAPAPKLRAAAGPRPSATAPPAPTGQASEPDDDDEWVFGDGVLEGAATALHEAVEEPFEFDPDVFRSAVRDRTEDAPAPPKVTPRYEPTSDDPLDNIGTILREALLS